MDVHLVILESRKYKVQYSLLEYVYLYPPSHLFKVRPTNIFLRTPQTTTIKPFLFYFTTNNEELQTPQTTQR